MYGVCFSFDLSRLWHFTLTVRKNYRALPYHNWNHGFSVSHCMYCMLKAIKDKGVFSVLQVSIYSMCLFLLEVSINQLGIPVLLLEHGIAGILQI